MRFSLILATIGRTEELHRFLQFLEEQSSDDFELLVVDQNGDDRLIPLLALFQGRFPIKHLRSEKGLSRARNGRPRAIKRAMSSLFQTMFLYPERLLDQVANFLESNPECSGITGIPLDENGRLAVGKYDSQGGVIDSANIWRRTTSITLFLKREVVDAIGEFDESLGAGAGTPWARGRD